MGANQLVNIDAFVRWARWLAVAGAGLFAAAAVIAAVLYRGRGGERYSPLNHFISELGEYGVSRAARFFNIALVLTNALLLPFVFALGFKLQSVAGWLGVACGVIACVFCGLVGVFPSNHIKPHALVASGFFSNGLATMLMMGIAILTQPEGAGIPSWLGVVALASILLYGAFMVATYHEQPNAVKLAARNPFGSYDLAAVLDMSKMDARPDAWLLPILEWATSLMTVLWFLLAALGSA